MVLSISANRKVALCEETGEAKADIEDYIWSVKDKHCFLCGKELNRSSDKIELDHNIPVSEGGLDTLENLNLTHASCNRYKRNHNTIDVRPHLKFQRFWEENAGDVNFRTALEYFGIKPSQCFIRVSSDGKMAEVESELGKVKVNVFVEPVGEKTHLFCFAALPVSCVENDDVIQPRSIKLAHLFSIATDISKNPLHEQPAVRLTGATDTKRILMFDGQHKTVANMINGRLSVVFKIYINISEQEAIELVNSIQSRIKKLPLTPFELAAKMSDEFIRKLEAYENEVGSANASEAGFVAWLDPDDRTRAKKSIESAVIDRVIGDGDLAFNRIIERPGRQEVPLVSIKESAFQNNVLKTLLFTKPLPLSYLGEGMKTARERESRNVVRLLNMIFDRGFTPRVDEDIEREELRLSRLKYQGSLQYMCRTFKQLASRLVIPQHDDETFYDREFSEEVWETISTYMDAFFKHPVWVADFASSQKLRSVNDALQKNQGIDAAFKAVTLHAAYCAGLMKIESDWAE
jgi:hypothetical protein